MTGGFVNTPHHRQIESDALRRAAHGLSDRYSSLPLLRDRFWAKVEVRQAGECWLWKGAFDGQRRGHMTVRGRVMKAPRIAWYLTHGDIAQGYVCHSCDNPSCVNPGHLWLGTCEDNVRDASLKGRHRGQSATHCANGHEFTEANTYWRPNGFRSRDCKTCIRERGQKRDRKRKEARSAEREAA